MKDSEGKQAVDRDVCSHCGRVSCDSGASLDIAIEKGHVRRASRAADGVYAAANAPRGTAHGVVFMTAILLVERLATAYNCDPRVILGKIARCFDVKEAHQRSANN